MKLVLTFLISLLLIPLAALHAADVPTKKPNILWFVVDDMSANFSCYGEQLIQTPHVDRLAREGTRFANAFVTAPVCSPCRSALITGMYQTSIGAHHHRSGRGELKIHLPQGVVPVPKLLQQAGYYTCIGSGLPQEADSAGRKGKRNGPGLGKTDYNFKWDASIYDSADWSGREAGQPFFMQVQLAGGKLRGGTDDNAKQLLARAKQAFGNSTDPDAVTLPPYYPRDPVLLRDWAAYLDAVRFTDKHVGDVLARLEKEGLLDNTLIIFMTDHGISHVRGKQFLYNEGTHIPFVVEDRESSRGKCARISSSTSTWRRFHWLPRASMCRQRCMAATCSRKTMRRARRSSPLATAATRPWNAFVASAPIASSTFATSIRTVLTCSPTLTRTARASCRPCDRCTTKPNSIRSRSCYCSVRPGLLKNFMNGRPTVGR